MGKNIFCDKKGELTTQQIIVLVVAIVSFAVILFFLFRLNLGQTTNEELCHNSVVTRGSAVVPSEAVPLNCHRKYLCITEDGTCEGLTRPEIEKVSLLDEIYQVLADEMANCWWMFGEGRVNYVGDDLSHNNYCSVCSQVYFDDSLESIVGENIGKDGLYNFLESNKIDETNSYIEYLFGGKDVLNSIKKESLEDSGVQTFGSIELNKQYFIVMGITSNVGLWQWGAGGAVAGAVVGAILLSNPAGWVVGAIAVGAVGGIGGTALGSVSDSINPEIAAINVQGRGIDNKFMAPTIVEANSVKFDALNCEEILTLA